MQGNNPLNLIGLFFFSFALYLFQSCQTDGPKPPDLSGIEIDLKVRRFEQDLFLVDTNDMSTGLSLLSERYPVFSDLYFQRILPAQGAPQGPENFIKGFIQHPAVRALYDSTQVLYEDFTPYAREVEQGLKYFNYYFPDHPLPPYLTTFLSEYAVGSIIYDDNALAVGLDFFLGADYPYRELNPSNPAFSDYLTRTFNPEHLVMKTLKPLIQDINQAPDQVRLLDLMVQNGKELYLLDHILPDTPDSILLEMTVQQTQWLSDNEREMWAYFLQEDLLYSSTFRDIKKYVDYSPHSPGMPPEAPGRTANWIGWQIVKAYMQRHPETSFSELVEIRDAQTLLAESRYKPKM